MITPTVTSYIISGDAMPPEIFTSEAFCLSRLRKISEQKTLAGKIQNACAELAIIAAVGDYCGAKPPIEYEYALSGKPYMKNPAHGHISVSHAGLAGACAISDYTVGIDIEKSDRDVSKILKRLLSTHETGAECPRPLETWCAKESFVKLTGEGLSRPFTEICARDGQITDMSNRRLAHYQVVAVAEYTVCVCSHVPFTLRIVSSVVC